MDGFSCFGPTGGDGEGRVRAQVEDAGFFRRGALSWKDRQAQNPVGVVGGDLAEAAHRRPSR